MEQDRKRGGVFWYGMAIIILSFIAVTGSNDGPVDGPLIFDGLFAALINFAFFVVPVILIRNWRSKRRARRAA